MLTAIETTAQANPGFASRFSGPSPKPGFTPPFLRKSNSSPERAGFTLTELLVVLIIIAVLAGLAIPNFTRTRERTLDEEARVALRLIQAAERIYLSKFGGYFRAAGFPVGLADINTYLQLELSSRSWDFSITATTAPPGATFSAETSRLPASSRTWSITQDTAADPVCAGSCL